MEIQPEHVTYEMGTGKHRATMSLENYVRAIQDELEFKFLNGITDGTGKHRAG